MVDVRFEDVAFIERRPEANLRKGNPPMRENYAQVIVQVIVALLPFIVEGGKKQWATFQRADRATQRKILRKWAWASLPARAMFASNTVADKAIAYLTSKDGKEAAAVAFEQASDPRAQRALAGALAKNPKGEIYDPDKEQFRRVVAAIYAKGREEGIPHKKAQSRAYAIATRQLQRHGYLVPGTNTPTKKGKSRAAEKRETPDATMKRQRYEVMLSRSRKSERYRVVPESRDGKPIYVIQPSGKYFFSEKKAQAVADKWNGSGELSTKHARAARVANPDDLQYRQNWVPLALGVASGVATLGDLAHRGYKGRKEKKRKKKDARKHLGLENPHTPSHWLTERYSAKRGKNAGEWIVTTQLAKGDGEVRYLVKAKSKAEAIKEVADRPRLSEFSNPRHLDERAGMSSYTTHVSVRNAQSRARTLGVVKGNGLLELELLPRSTKAKWQQKRRDVLRSIEAIDQKMHTVSASVSHEMQDSGPLSPSEKKQLSRLWATYNKATNDQVLENEKMRARKKARRVRNPVKSRMKGIAKAGIGNYWAGVKSMGGGNDYPAPTISKQFVPGGDDYFLFVFDPRGRRGQMVSKLMRASGKWSKIDSITNQIFADIVDPQTGKSPLRYKVAQLKSRGDYLIVGPAGNYQQRYTRKAEAQKAAKKLNAKQLRAFLGTAGLPIAGYKTSSAKTVRNLTEILESHNYRYESEPGLFSAAKLPTPKAKRAAVKTPARKQAPRRSRRLEEIEAELAAIDAQLGLPVRRNSWVAAARAAAMSPLGKKVLAEAAIVGTMVIGDRLMSKGKVSKNVTIYVQKRMEKELGYKPTGKEVAQMVKQLDPNQDGEMTRKELDGILKRATTSMAKAKTVNKNPRRYRRRR